MLECSTRICLLATRHFQRLPHPHLSSSSFQPFQSPLPLLFLCASLSVSVCYILSWSVQTLLMNRLKPSRLPLSLKSLPTCFSPDTAIATDSGWASPAAAPLASHGSHLQRLASCSLCATCLPIWGFLTANDSYDTPKSLLATYAKNNPEVEGMCES